MIATEDCALTINTPIIGEAVNLAFPLYSETELTVTCTDGTIAQLNVDYLITLFPPAYATAEITPLAGLINKATNKPVYVRRDTRSTQPLNLPINGRLPESAIERELDRSAMRASEYKFAVDDLYARGLVFPYDRSEIVDRLVTVGPDGNVLFLPFEAFVPDVNASWRVGDTILAYGGLPGLGTPQELPFKNAIQAGGEIYIPPGAWRISSRVTATLTRDVKLIFAPNARVYVDSTITTQAFLIDGQGLYRFIVEGGQFDFTAVPQGTPPNYDQGTCWELVNIPWWDISGGKYIAANDYLAGKGDTAIAATNSRGSAHHNWFQGWADNAIYLTGGALANDASDNGGPTFVHHNMFIQCSVGVSVKRRNSDAIITGNRFFGCYVDVGAYEVSGGEIEPGDRLTISNNRSKRASGPIELRGGTGETMIVGNDIEDFGYDLAGSPAVDRVAIRLLGSRDCLVSMNKIKMRDLAGTSQHIGVNISNYTVSGGVTYTAGRNRGDGNMFRNLHRALIEGVGTDANRFMSCDFETNVAGAEVYGTRNVRSEFAAHAVWTGSDVSYRHYRGAAASSPTLLQNL